MRKKQDRKKVFDKKHQKPSVQNAAQFLNKKYMFFSGLITFAAFIPVLFNAFINFDDPQYVYKNDIILNFSGENLEAIFTQAFVGNYQPVTMFVYMLIHSLFKADPTGYHLFSLLFHTANTLLVFIIFFHLSGRNLTALITSLLFGIHPLHVESVAWASAMKDVLYTFFFLMAMYYYWYYYIRSAVKKETRYMILSMAFFVLSVLSKPQAVVLPLAFFLVDYLVKRKFNVKMILEKVPFLVLSLVFGLLAVVKQKESGAVQDYGYFESWERILFSCYGLMNYFYKIILPVNLSIFYPYPETNDQINSNWVYAAPAILALLGFLFWKYLRNSREAVFGMQFFLLTIALVLQFIPVGDAIIADRYTYLPSAGLFFMIGFRLETSLNNKPGKRRNVLVLLGVLGLLLAGLTFQRSRLWKDSITIYTDGLRTEQVPILLNNRGVAYSEEGKDTLALLDFRELSELKPRYPNGLKNLALTHQKLNNPKGAYDAFARALQYYPEDNMLYLGRARAAKSIGKTNEALADAEYLIRKNPKDIDAIFIRAEIYGQKGSYEKSLDDLNTVIALKPDFAEAYANRGIVNSMVGKTDKAYADYSQALKLNPGLKNIYMNRSILLKSAGRLQEALNDALIAQSKGAGVNQSYIDELKSQMGK